MTETVTLLPRRRLLLVASIAAAAVLTALSTMMHGSHIEARLQGPSGWTGWVTLDLLLVLLPILVPIISFVVLVVAGQGRRASGAVTLAIWLASAFSSCALAVFWI
jgi:phosphoglycerol transferase MdoB-like AlkP superfamily enzyme